MEFDGTARVQFGRDERRNARASPTQQLLRHRSEIEIKLCRMLSVRFQFVSWNIETYVLPAGGQFVLDRTRSANRRVRCRPSRRRRCRRCRRLLLGRRCVRRLRWLGRAAQSKDEQISNAKHGYWLLFRRRRARLLILLRRRYAIIIQIMYLFFLKKRTLEFFKNKPVADDEPPSESRSASDYNANNEIRQNSKFQNWKKNEINDMWWRHLHSGGSDATRLAKVANLQHDAFVIVVRLVVHVAMFKGEKKSLWLEILDRNKLRTRKLTWWSTRDAPRRSNSRADIATLAQYQTNTDCERKKKTRQRWNWL